MRGKVLHLLFTCGFALAGTLASGAQTNATPEVSSVVSCLVTDNSEAVIANAEVIFESNAGVVRTHTDQTGSVKISGIQDCAANRPSGRSAYAESIEYTFGGRRSM